MEQLLMVIHVFACIGIVILVLLQHGKGADIGAAFGSGASSTVFGSQGSGSFLLRLTSAFAAIFFITSLSLGYLATSSQKKLTGVATSLPIALEEQENIDANSANQQQDNKRSDTISPNED